MCERVLLLEKTGGFFRIRALLYSFMKTDKKQVQCDHQKVHKKGQVHPKICTFSLLSFSAPVYHGEHVILKGRLAKLSGSLFFFFPF